MEPEHLIEVRSLDQHLSGDQSFGSALARMVGALATADGAPNLAQFATVTDLAGEGLASALFHALVLNAIESGVSVDWALQALARSAVGVDQSARDGGFTLLCPLIALQNGKARALAAKVAKALAIRPRADELAALPPEAERNVLANLGDQARKLVRGRLFEASLADTVADFGRQTGNRELVDSARRCLAGKVEPDQLRLQARHAAEAMQAAVLAYQHHAETQEALAAQAQSLAAAALELKRQVQQRLALVDARITYERNSLSQDIDDAVHDAGNAIELAIAERLDTDQWQDGAVWDSIARHQFGQEMARRLDRVVRRKEDALNLLTHDLRLFQSDLRLSQNQVFQREHHAALAQLMPRLRIGTRLVNQAESAANLTLMGGAMAAAGTGTAAYVFGVAVVMPVVAPVAPFVGGAVLLAGAFKWFADAGQRKRSEIRDKRRAFEEALRKRLTEAESAYLAQLEQVAAGFHESARQVLTPILLEAEAAGRVQQMRARVAGKVMAQSQAALTLLEREVGQVERDR